MARKKQNKRALTAIRNAQELGKIISHNFSNPVVSNEDRSQLLIYSIFDKKASEKGSYNTPFFKASEAEACRDFIRMCRTPSSLPHDFPEDYELCLIGKVSLITGMLESISPTTVLKAAVAKNS